MAVNNAMAASFPPKYSDDPAAYMRWYRQTHKEQQRKVVARYYAANQSTCNTRTSIRNKDRYANDEEFRTRARDKAAQYYKLNTSRAKQQAKLWRERNGIRRSVYNRMRRQGLTGTIPPWYEEPQVRQLYEQCKVLNKTFKRTGPDRFEVDHIIPLVSKTVCGLHCWANLQILCKSENSAKRNTYQQEW